MEISEAKRYVRLREWSAMIQACKASGKTVKTWCEENGIGKKTYYYRLKRVRLAALQEPEKAGIFFPTAGVSPSAFAKLPFGGADESAGMPETPMPNKLALTVRMGAAKIDVNNGANPETIAATLRVLQEIC